jgi:putative ABC transport system substrate-binding protein
MIYRPTGPPTSFKCRRLHCPFLIAETGNAAAGILTLPVIGVASWPLVARGQPSAVLPLIAYLGGGKQAVVVDLVNAFRDGLRELGHDEDRNVRIAYRFAEGRAERLPALAEEVVRLNPAVIVTGAVDSAVPVKKLTTSIPIVCPALPMRFT